MLKFEVLVHYEFNTLNIKNFILILYLNLYYLYNCRLYRKSFIIKYDVYNIHIIITLNYIFFHPNLNFHGTKQFLFFHALSGVARGHGICELVGRNK